MSEIGRSAEEAQQYVQTMPDRQGFVGEKASPAPEQCDQEALRGIEEPISGTRPILPVLIAEQRQPHRQRIQPLIAEYYQQALASLASL